MPSCEQLQNIFSSSRVGFPVRYQGSKKVKLDNIRNQYFFLQYSKMNFMYMVGDIHIHIQTLNPEGHSSSQGP